jgi:hypothetical protein
MFNMTRRNVKTVRYVNSIAANADDQAHVITATHGYLQAKWSRHGRDRALDKFEKVAVVKMRQRGVTWTGDRKCSRTSRWVLAFASSAGPTREAAVSAGP